MNAKNINTLTPAQKAVYRELEVNKQEQYILQKGSEFHMMRMVEAKPVKLRALNARTIKKLLATGLLKYSDKYSHKIKIA